jgi:spore maturation protein CgeB
MKVLVLGKTGGVTNWEAEVVAGLRGAGHEVMFRATRDPRISAHLERLFLARIADDISRRIDRFRPDLILVVRGAGVDASLIAHIAAKRNRPPLVGWVGDLFDETRVDNLNQFDALGYTDTGLLDIHRRFGLRPKSGFIPHAADLDGVGALGVSGGRRHQMVFVGNPTAHRRSVIGHVAAPVALFGLGWTDRRGVQHHRAHPWRIRRPQLASIYASHFACLNIKNENNVINGLNQRNFSPLALGCAVVTDSQKDIPLCFDVQSEIFTYDSEVALNDIYREILAHPRLAYEIGERGRKRVLADHTYGRRLEAFRGLVGLTNGHQ